MSYTMERPPKFFAELKQSNDEILRVLDANHKKSPYFDFSETFQDYIDHVAGLYKRYPIPSAPEEPPKTPTLNINGSSGGGNKDAGGGHSLFRGELTTTTTSMNTFNPSGVIQNNNSLFNHDHQSMASSVTQNNSEQPATEADDDDSQPPPQPALDIFEEPNYKYTVKCKLYERVLGGASKPTLLGCGSLFVKDLEVPSPTKLHLIVRKDPDLRTILLNQVITSSIPLKPAQKALQIIIPGADGKTKSYIIKVKDEQVASEVYAQLQSIKNAK